MKAAPLKEPYEFTIQEKEIPEPGPEEVLIEVSTCGICGTDLEAYMGNEPSSWNIEYPFQMGHELSGTVKEVGTSVPDLAELEEGDAVVPDGRVVCNVCHYCREGQYNLCENQSYIAAGFSQYAVYPYENLISVPESVSLDEAAFTEPLSCCINGNEKLNDVPLGGIGVVIGAGPIGLLHMQLLQNRGLGTVIVDLNSRRLQAAKELGADYTVEVESQGEVNQDVVDLVNDVSHGRGADVVVSAAGHDPSVLQEAIDISSKRGQIVYFAATMSDPVTLNLDPIHYEELTIVGSHDSTFGKYETALEVIERGVVDVEPIISHRFPLEEIDEAFEVAKKKEDLKVMVDNPEAQ
jgi:L-iditol 2-dehydrogenase